MVEVALSPEIRRIVDCHQRSERTAAVVYRHLARRTRDAASRDIFLRLAEEETRHAEIWQYYCGRELGPNRLSCLGLILSGYLLGQRFLFRLMKGDENATVKDYKKLSADFPELEDVYPQEEIHEEELHRLLENG